MLRMRTNMYVGGRGDDRQRQAVGQGGHAVLTARFKNLVKEGACSWGDGGDGA